MAKQAKALKTKALASAQSAVSSVGTKISAATLGPMITKIASRPWGGEATAAIKAGTEAIAAAIGVLHQVWAEQTLLLKTEPCKFSIAELKGASDKVEKIYGELDCRWLSDIRALK